MSVEIEHSIPKDEANIQLFGVHIQARILSTRQGDCNRKNEHQLPYIAHVESYYLVLGYLRVIFPVTCDVKIGLARNLVQ